MPLDRDVIALFEAGEEGAVRFGIQFMVDKHLAEIESEFCLAEGGSLNRQGGKVTFASIQTLEKIPRAITLTARGTAGHGSVPLRSNAVVKLTTAVSAVAKWKPPIGFNETTAAYFKRLATHLGSRQRRTATAPSWAATRKPRTPPTSTSSTTSRATPRPSAPRSRRR